MAYAVPDPYRTAIRSSVALTYTVDASYNGSAVAGATGLRPVGGSISDTSKPGVRRTLRLELAPTRGLFDLLAPIGTTLAVTAHVQYTDRTSVDIPMGVFDVDSQTISEGVGRLSLTAPDKWQRIVRARFLGPTASSPGLTVTDQITQLVQGALGVGETVRVTATSRETVGALTWDKDRAQAIIDLANGIGAWVYFDRDGLCTIADLPTLGQGADWTIDASTSGVLVSLDRSRSRESTYNIVVVTSTASDAEQFTTQYVWDSDPSSATYVGPGPWGPTPPTTTSPFGLVPYYFDTPLPLTTMGAIQAGGTVLSRTVGQASSVSLTAVPNPAIDAFDTLAVLPPGYSAVTIVTGDPSGGPVAAPFGTAPFGTSPFGGVGSAVTRTTYQTGAAPAVELHMADTVTHPLDVSQPQQIAGRSTRTDAYS